MMIDKNSKKRLYRFTSKLLVILQLLTVYMAQGQYITGNCDVYRLPIYNSVRAYSFNLQDVRLLDSRFKDNMDREGRWMLSLPVNRLLHSFYVNAGMQTLQKDSKTKMPEPLGGWESLDMELRGHSIGHLLSGLSLQYASTGNTVFKIKLDSLISGLALVQATLSHGGYLSAFPEEYIDRNINGQSVWAPWYTLHKICAGLIDAYQYAGNQQALTIVKGMAAWAWNKTSKLPQNQLNLMLRNEFGGINEAWYNLYAITGDTLHKQLGDLFYHHAALDPLLRNEDNLNTMHANTIIPKVTGIARAYELTGNASYRQQAIYFWHEVINGQTYVNGSNSDLEHFIAPGKISQHITGYTGETCNTYNMLKLTRHLFTWTADEKYAEYYERALYNQILGQQDPQSGMVCYFTPLAAGSYRLYSTPDQSFWCCVGSGFESHSKYAEAIYYHDAHGVFINLFIPSRLRWADQGLVLRQETHFPDESTIHLWIDSVNNKDPLSLYVRYPHWATQGCTVKVNGHSFKVNAKPGSYINIHRKWRQGDQIDINFPMSVHLETTPDNQQIAAVLYGPVVLAGLAGTQGMQAPAPFHDPSDPYQYYSYDYHIPANLNHTLNLAGKKVVDLIRRTNTEKLLFQTNDAPVGQPVTLAPLYDIQRERYVVYWNIK